MMEDSGHRMELDGAPVTAGDLAPLAMVNFGHFTSMYVQDGAVRGLELHLDRLVRDCRIVFAAELDPDLVRDRIRHALGDVDQPVVVRVTIYDPALTMARPGDPAKPRVHVNVRAASASPQAPLRLQSVAWSRDTPEVKHVGLFGAELRRARAQRAGFDDVLLTSADGLISEIATSNIGLITTDGELIWPEADVLNGTTMQLLNRVRDREVLTRKVALTGLHTFAGAVATNAATGVRPIESVDNVEWPVHDLVATLRDQYDSIQPQQI
ncbi:aminotransferase class IV [Nocardia nova]|uniref:aminotransferase class IV n=1 Tax=Nocardia nova TaxID=37330 RepID=UPI003404C337